MPDYSAKHQLGFTLIELMVVMVIVGILSAIAVPQYMDYKRRAFDVRAREDLRNVAIAEEAYFLQSERYLSCTNQDCSQLPGIASLSAGVQLSIEASDTSFVGQAHHTQGSGAVFHWDSERGGMLN